MSGYRDSPSRGDRVKAIAAVVAVHAGLAALILSSPGVRPGTGEQAPTQLVDVALPPPPPPPPPPEPKPAPRPEREQGAAGKKAEPSPIVAPPARLPAKTPVAAAPVAGSGSASTAGAASAGTGTGAGGTGSGRGGGGTGGGGIGEDARLISGGLTRRDYRRLRALGASTGQAVLAILVGPDGRVAQCSTRQSSGNRALDAELCAIMQPRMVWAPARDRSGRPLTVGIYYTATWSRD
jgi:periplasmic protein TonB